MATLRGQPLVEDGLLEERCLGGNVPDEQRISCRLPTKGELPWQYTPVDMHVGRRLRQRRFLLGMNQSKLGAAVALSFQRVHKYERGTNRMGSSRLFEFVRVLDVPVSYFFGDMPGPAVAFEQDKNSPAKRETRGLGRAYHMIRADQVRTRRSRR
jgi:transcriptional regulator with XRE-family HTH domain